MLFSALISGAIATITGLLSLSVKNPVIDEDVALEVDLKWMRAAIDAMPPCHFNAYGSVIVNATSNEILCQGYNSQLQLGDPTEHGEVNAIRNCVRRFSSLGWTPLEIAEIWPQSWIYTTAEPCPMCGTTILQAGFRRVVYGTSSPSLISLGWTEYLVSVRNEWLRRAAVVQPGFGAGRPITQVVGPRGDNETDPLLAWQFNASYPCPPGCGRSEGVCRLEYK
ncbi:hypothetical protein CspHIS471_0211130 [Cutaneotrichosporon sp. HIS471]|nr:hypothetical protein CspHIS471_0211130 [Cutaneotrichosporon sp. HIS471]